MTSRYVDMYIGWNVDIMKLIEYTIATGETFLELNNRNYELNNKNGLG